ncbi:neo-calmodulin-like [Dendronephthya gigantea]|uniref:neo-calmodulin-like n=1 Tax=Dendronephthya gigantea TaxID=151771 RepID=UPI00106A7798|nr:neo-calmodulin-like [Dendronephthya gigantea]XP_028403733.1 neo-calmodulin-like [Dendronephthya gigantea]
MEAQNGEDTNHINEKDNPGNEGGMPAEKSENIADKPLEESISKESLSEIREAFNIFDKDGNGYITASELRHFLSSLGYNMTEAELMDMMNKIDADGNGAIDFPEFLELSTKKLHVLSEEELAQQTFNVFDRSQKGHISTNDLRHIFTTLEQTFGEPEMQEMLLQADFDQDGRVEFKDFLKMMKKETSER